jgi:hypothetical protein
VNPKAMMWAITNGFFPMIMPSKTSIYAQPNDTSANMALSVKMSETSVEMHLCSLSTPSLHDYNTLMANSHIKFEENDKVIRTGENCATSGMAKTGLYPFNYYCSSWCEGIERNRGLQDLIKSKFCSKGVTVADRFWTACALMIATQIFYQEKRKRLSKLCGRRHSKPTFLKTDESDMTWDAHCILTQLVHTYSLDKERDKSQPPIPMTAVEKAAHKLFNFAPSGERDYL